MKRMHEHGRTLGWIITSSVALGLAGHVHADAPGGRFMPGKEIVLDTKTGLTWQQPFDGTSRDWAAAVMYCEGLELDEHDDWRLPSMKELQTIVDETRYNPAVDPNAFLNMPTDVFWTSSIWATNPSNAWVVYFSYGYSSIRDTTYSGRVRCVR